MRATCVLNISNNVLTGEMRLGDIGIKRGDEVLLNALVTESGLDATTIGDSRRVVFEETLLEVKEAMNLFEAVRL
ncbi:MAG: hypothetical protein R2684_17595 [Pyrinomonadaceae bacterium]